MITTNTPATTSSFTLLKADAIAQLSWVYPSGCLRTKSMALEATEAGDMELGREFENARATLQPGREPIVVVRKPFLDGATTLENHDSHHVGVLHHSALTGRANLFASNVVLVHEPACTRTRWICAVASLLDGKMATHLYPADTLRDCALLARKPGKAERPIGIRTKHFSDNSLRRGVETLLLLAVMTGL